MGIICDHAPACATKLSSAPLRGPISIKHGTGEQNMYSGGSRSEFGGTGGARGHILCPSKVNQIDTGFGQKAVKNGQKGVPPVFTWFWGTLRARSPLEWAVGDRFFGHPPYTKTAFRAKISRWGSKVPARFPNRVLGWGGALSSL